MLKRIRKLITESLAAPETADTDREHATQLAAAGLMVEVMRADFDLDDIERATIRELVTDHFALTPEEAHEIETEAERSNDAASSLYPMVQTLVEALSVEQRGEIVELLWRVAFADGRLDKYEEAAIRRIADLLYVPHSRFIRAKHDARNN